jgi:hypothetical protein
MTLTQRVADLADLWDEQASTFPKEKEANHLVPMHEACAAAVRTCAEELREMLGDDSGFEKACRRHDEGKITSHQLAKKLLASPDLPVLIPGHQGFDEILYVANEAVLDKGRGGYYSRYEDTQPLDKAPSGHVPVIILT